MPEQQATVHRCVQESSIVRLQIVLVYVEQRTSLLIRLHLDISLATEVRQPKTITEQLKVLRLVAAPSVFCIGRTLSTYLDSE